MSNQDQKEYIMQKLKDSGCRITSQRSILVDIILENECGCCKEIYYQAVKKDPTIGLATVYRMVKTLEDTGLIQRKNMYRITVDDEPV
jgi:Fur family ferric uptake transcriptional regulator